MIAGFSIPTSKGIRIKLSILGEEMQKDGACKIEKIKNAFVPERVREGRIMLELIRKWKRIS